MSAQMYLVFFAISSWTLLQKIEGQIPTRNSCDYFRYIQENGEVIGLITLPNDLSQEYQIYVNMSVAAFLRKDQNIRLQLVTGIDDIRNGQPLQYRVYFPIQTVIPFQTKVEFNGQLYCAGPPQEQGMGGVTSFWASNYQLTGTPRKRPVFPRPPPPPNPPPTQMFTFDEDDIVIYGTPVTRIPVTIPTTTRRNTPRPTPDSECGVVTTSPFAPLIYDGQTVRPGQFPWLAALLVKIEGKAFAYRCTGTIVSTKHVVSGAFCQVFYKKEDFVVFSGGIDIQDQSYFSGIISRVSHIDVHPRYNRSANFNIAVFTLDKKLDFTDDIKPICIWQDGGSVNDLIGRNGTIAGWGSDPAGTRKISEAQYLAIPIVSESECKTSSVLQPLFSRNTFCAGLRNGAGICNGDGGAGLMIQNENGVWHLLGIVHNFLKGKEHTCDTRNYFLFFNVAKERQWLISKIL